MGACVAAALVGACTFPDVDYADAGTDAGAGAGGSASTSTSSGGACLVPAMCATDATACAKSAKDKNVSCVKDCEDKQECALGCENAQQEDLGACADACKGCAEQTCGSSPTNCRKLVGL
jgi:hypothetical protein